MNYFADKERKLHKKREAITQKYGKQKTDAGRTTQSNENTCCGNDCEDCEEWINFGRILLKSLNALSNFLSALSDSLDGKVSSLYLQTLQSLRE